MTVTFTPLGRRILVTYLEETPISPLAVGVPKSGEVVRWATVIKVGSKCRDTQPGQKVLVSSLQGVAVGGDDHHVLPEQSVLLRAA